MFQVSQKLKAKLADLPDKPGCYLMRDRLGRIIYVGKAASLRKRVQSYFRKATFHKADPKLRGLIKSIHDLEYIVVKNEAEALLTEGQLIKDYKPRYNVSFRDDKRFLLLRVDPDEPFPRLKLCRIRRSDSCLYFGPYASSTAARATLDFVEKKFGLRKCSPRVPGKEAWKHCINDIVRYCSAPCVGRTTAAEYAACFAEACAFLRGERPQYMKELKEEMAVAAKELDFEKAAALRDIMFMLHATIKQNAKVMPSAEMRREEGLAGVEALQRVLGIAHVPHVIEAYDISNISGTYAVASMVCSANGLPQRNRYRRFRIKTIEGSNDPAMMAEVVRRRFTGLIRDGGTPPGLVLVDGGATQVSAARAELAKLELDIPVAGLAKKYELLHWIEKDPPIRLPRDSAELKVLQRIRDEAHRFALDYHHRLRRKRISESVLDDISGVGARKKTMLLAHFGSVRRIAKATESEITEVPGVGTALAKQIKAALQ